MRFTSTDWSAMHAAGFNAATDGGVQDNGDAQAAAGLTGMVWVDAYNNVTCAQTMTNAAIQALVQANVSAGHSGLRYEVGDEPTTNGCNAAAAYTSMTAAVHAVDPTAKTWTFDDQFQIGNPVLPNIPMAGSVDILDFDVYPCQSGPCDYSVIDSAVQQIHAAGLKNWEFGIQDFSATSWRWPTPAEIEAQFAHWQNSGAIGYWVFAWDYLGGSVTAQAGNVAALQAINSLPLNPACIGTPLFTSYFSWFDKASPGMFNDNIHLLNTGASTSTGCVSVNGLSIPFNVDAGHETYITFPPGTIGGPVVVNVISGPAVLASQRVQYYQSFNEVWAMSPSRAAKTSYLSWFDKASPGMVGDNIHVLNPGATAANVTVSMPGSSSLAFALAAGAESYASFPTGTIGGPVTINADQPVLASQRVQYFQTFSEVVARSAAEATTTSYFNWFDKASAGMVGDNIHLLNTGGSLAHITVAMPGASASTTLPSFGETYVTFAQGHIGGPITVTSDQPVLASQRVQYFQSFNETPSASAAQALTSSHVMWFDKASPGMVGDNIHVLNTSGAAASVTVSLPGASSDVFSLAAGAETYVTFPSGNIGGPVTITSDQPVLAAQRVQYYQTFSEIPAA